MYKMAARNAQRRACKKRVVKPLPPLKKKAKPIPVKTPNAVKKLEAGYEPTRADPVKVEARLQKRMHGVTVVKHGRRSSTVSEEEAPLRSPREDGG